ncbi:MAG: hypothetical protein ACRBDI_05490 [Alphaproteobacteria bacterium]
MAKLKTIIDKSAEHFGISNEDIRDPSRIKSPENIQAAKLCAIFIAAKDGYDDGDIQKELNFKSRSSIASKFNKAQNIYSNYSSVEDDFVADVTAIARQMGIALE